MASIKDAEAQELIKKAAEELEKLEEMRPPEWARYVKTGAHKERPPLQDNWWSIRAASLLRRIYLGNSGVSRLRRVYGGRKNRGHKPEHKVKASGNIIRKSLQQLEKAGLVKTDKKKGRSITPKGQQMLDKIASEIRKEKSGQKNQT